MLASVPPCNIGRAPAPDLQFHTVPVPQWPNPAPSLPAPPSPGRCRSQLRKLREVGDAIFARAEEAAARPAAVKLASDFLELTRKALNSWPEVKPWLNASDIAALAAKVQARVAAAVRAAARCRLRVPAALPAAWGCPCWPCIAVVVGWRPACCQLACDRLFTLCRATAVACAGGGLCFLADWQAGGAGQAGCPRGPGLQDAGGHKLAGPRAKGEAVVAALSIVVASLSNTCCCSCSTIIL